MEICVVGDPDTVTGFKLAGIKEGYKVGEASEALGILRDLIKEKDMGLIIVTERIGEELREEIKAMTEGKVTPIIVEIPDKGGPIEKKIDPIKELVKRAVGIEIKFG